MRLDEPTSYEEIVTTISSLHSRRAPGPDGFPMEFFQSFSQLLSPQLSQVISDSFRKTKLPARFNEACISLIAKKSKYPTETVFLLQANFFLNVDVKILAKIWPVDWKIFYHLSSLKTRPFLLKTVIPILLDILDLPSSPVPECVLSLDAEKAFNRVEWKYLFTTLEIFNYGSGFISWIKLLYSSPMASILTNFQQSQPFNQRGTHQGCPLSPLFCLMAQGHHVLFKFRKYTL